MPTINVPIKAQLTWVVAQDKRSHFWVGTCPPLQLVAQGQTYTELVEAINECLQALFSELMETGDLEDFLREHNWQPTTALPNKPNSRVRFDIPYEIKRRSTHDFETVPC